jgi:segregation and condensation protein B
MTTANEPEAHDAEEPVDADEAEAHSSGREAPPAEQLPAFIEALLFVADGPVAPVAIARVLGLHPREIEAPLEQLADALQGRGVRLQRGPEGAQLVTAPLASSYVEQFLGLESAKRLSTAALETLAIIAYRQPVTRAQVEAIRGVNSDAAIDTLRTRGLVDITGRADSPGRPALFATTQRFLEHFGLERPDQLPPLPEELAGATAARLTEQAAQQLPLAPFEPQSPARAEPALPHPTGAGLHEGEGAARRAAPERGPHLPGMGAPLPRSGAAGPPGAPRPVPPGSGPPRIG